MSDLRECVTGDTLVVLTDGKRVPIRSLVGSTPTQMPSYSCSSRVSVPSTSRSHRSWLRTKAAARGAGVLHHLGGRRWHLLLGTGKMLDALG